MTTWNTRCSDKETIIPAPVALEFHTQISVSRICDPKGTRSHMLRKKIPEASDKKCQSITKQEADTTKYINLIALSAEHKN